MDIKGTAQFSGSGSKLIHIGTTSGVFTSDTKGTYMTRAENASGKNTRLVFTASKNWTGSTSSAGNHSHTITLNKSSLHGKSATVQPNALKLRVKTIYK